MFKRSELEDFPNL